MVQFLASQAEELSNSSPKMTMVLAGVGHGLGIHADLSRGGLQCFWECGVPWEIENEDSDYDDESEPGIRTFCDVRSAMWWLEESVNKGKLLVNGRNTAS